MMKQVVRERMATKILNGRTVGDLSGGEGKRQ